MLKLMPLTSIKIFLTLKMAANFAENQFLAAGLQSAAALGTAFRGARMFIPSQIVLSIRALLNIALALLH